MLADYVVRNLSRQRMLEWNLVGEERGQQPIEITGQAPTQKLNLKQGNLALPHIA